MNDVREIASFGATASAAEVRRAAAGMESWLATQTGFVSRVLVGPDAEGRWVDLVRWRSQEAAEAAAAQIMNAPAAGAFMAVIDPGTVSMRHLPLALEQG